MAFDIYAIMGSLLMLMLLSRILYKDTMAAILTEHIYIGVSAGYMLVIGIKAVINNAFNPLLEGRVILIIPIILGFLLYTQLSAKTRVIARIPLALIIGLGSALSIRRVLTVYLIQYLHAAAKPIFGVAPITALNNILIIISLISALSYYVMGKEQTGTYGKITKIGRYVLMVVFGLYFGGQVMTRVVILSGRFEFILKAFNII